MARLGGSSLLRLAFLVMETWPALDKRFTSTAKDCLTTNPATNNRWFTQPLVSRKPAKDWQPWPVVPRSDPEQRTWLRERRLQRSIVCRYYCCLPTTTQHGTKAPSCSS